MADVFRQELPLALALDVGTSSCRAGVYDALGRRLADVGEQIAYMPTFTSDGGAELDPDVLVTKVAAAIDRVAAQMGLTLTSIAAVGISAFWHSLLGVDTAGNAVTPLYLWMDARSRGAAEELRHELDEARVHARTGCVLHWSYWPAKLRWLREAHADTYRAVDRWLSFGEYLALKLFGRTSVSTSMASATGLFDQHTGAWDHTMLAALEFDPARLAPLAAPGESWIGLRPEFATRWPPLSRVPWLPAVGDGACSNVGAGCTTRTRAALMIGTSGAMRVLWRAADVEIPWGAWCYHADDSHFVLGGALDDGGSLFAWLRQTLRLPALEEAEAAVAAIEPDAHGLTVFPAWGGERSPGWADDARGAIVGMRFHTTPVEILRAALEGVALRFGAIDAILRQAVPEAQEIVATGGALLHSPAWLQIMADVLGRPVGASEELEASSRGAALLALASINKLAGDKLAGGIDRLEPIIERVYEPIAAHTARYRAAAARQAHLYEVLVRSPLGAKLAEVAPAPAVHVPMSI